jgi:hypothetical protein
MPWTAGPRGEPVGNRGLGAAAFVPCGSECGVKALGLDARARMPPSNDLIAAASRNSLAVLGGDYVVGADGVVVFPGKRPGVGWHVHGWLERWLWILVEGVPERRRVRKRRWLYVSTGRTCHSRPPDEWGPVQFCFLIVVLKLWPWLNGDVGLHNTSEVDHALDDHGCSRTVQRWLRRASAQALELQQAIRSALIERCEPRPVEHLFPGGLSPPELLTRRRWKEPDLVGTLHRALAMLFAGAVKLSIPTSVLLAEARGR